jgi:peptidoglycan/xylan/chitin deacetylase (PgdA/CDA1 family)
LTFHRLVPDDVKKKKFRKNQWVGSIKIFEEMIKFLYDNGYKTISTEEFYKWYIGKVQYDKKTVLITIDDGFYEDYYLVYPIIKKYNYKATSFVVGSRIKNKTKLYNKYTTSYLGLDVINKVRKEYPFYEFQSHSFNMHFQPKNKNGYKSIIFNMTYEELENDCLNNNKFNFTTIAYPYGHFNEKAKEVMKSHGYLIAFGFAPFKYATRNSDRFGIPRIKLN